MMRTCALDGCEKVIGSHSLFCRAHLELLPQGMIYHIHAAYHDYRRNIAGAGQRYLDLVESAKQLIAERAARDVAADPVAERYLRTAV